MTSSSLLLMFAYVCMTYATTELPVCKRRECAKYTVIGKKDKYEVRRYTKHNTATHTTTGPKYRQAKSENFRPLFRYIKGNNEKQQKIEMTVPVFSGVQMATVDGRRRRTNTYTMTFFMPSEVTNPPAPMDNQIKIGTFGPITAYVKTFGGWAKEGRVFKFQEELRQALIADNIQFDENMFYVASFNPPWQKKNRHNELIYLAA